MNDIEKPPVVEPIAIAGPAGALEGLIEIPRASQILRIGVICHPHPLQGGTMTNKVVHMLARTMHTFNVATCRFNFRGVGASEGVYDNGVGEVEDAIKVAEFVRMRWPGAQLWLAGFSFGGAVALTAAAKLRPQRLITVAPAVTQFDPQTLRLPQCPWLVVQGDQDEVISFADVNRWINTLSQPPALATMAGAGHFFHGRLNDLKETVADWLGKIE